MKKITAFLFAAVMALSMFWTGTLPVMAETPSVNTSGQVVPKTKKTSRKVYRKGRWVTVTTWKKGKKITKKVWRKGNHYGHKTVNKTKEVIIGPTN